jgi:drug/metabolite transporter (DMT)-like permease
VRVAKAREERTALAVGLMMLAFLSFIFIDVSAKWLTGKDFQPLQVAFIRYAGHLIASIVIFFPSGGWTIFQSNAPKLQTTRAIFLLLSTVCNFAALVYLPLTITVPIMFASPLVVCLLSIPFLGEKVGMRRLAAVFVGFLGVLVIAQPGGSQFHWAMAFSVAALMSASGYFIMTRMLAGTDDNPVSQIYASGVATLLLLPVGIYFWQWPTTLTDTLVMLGIGLFGAFGHSLLTVAHRYAPASTLAPLVYVQILYVSILSWIVFGQAPTAVTLAGAAIIIGSGLYIWLRERRLSRT